ncbi:NADH dehydrogenase [ubiquinone] 1 alpha subcomplex subunit 4-like 2 [Rhizophlyctis rosea]|uniref:NADH dehydrogenase [ubiquinone] 1 alpha subcomplex subunit 4-like 2 n=1 Tax=Rhizophlyctis rosea TaxID=64517 RepID=A0AAD5X5X2_9FUNG|nr:NADH dehydrogenase [ubiquinone] 1 alpha subcomplex subunit 4-like 2 [Rhizophlyctis rosea]
MGAHVKHSLRNVPSAVYPLLGFMACAVGGAAFYLGRLATRPDVVWARKSNPQPWNSVKQNETIKMWDPKGAFEKSWSRW